MRRVKEKEHNVALKESAWSMDNQDSSLSRLPSRYEDLSSFTTFLRLDFLTPQKGYFSNIVKFLLQLF